MLGRKTKTKLIQNKLTRISITGLSEPTMAAASFTGGDIPPSQTLYLRCAAACSCAPLPSRCRHRRRLAPLLIAHLRLPGPRSNLNHKTSKEVTRTALHALFAPFGRIMDVVVSRAARSRGQAWVVFHDIGAATNALRQLQAFNFFDRPLRVAFAKGKSHAVAQADGTFHLMLKERAAAAASSAAGDGGGRSAPPPRPPADAEERDSDEEMGSAEGGGGAAAGGAAVRNPPHKLLFAEGLPPVVTAAMLETLFGQYNGFSEVRLASGKGVAFVEFGDDVQAGIALEGLDGFKLSPTDVMRVNFAKQ